MRKLILSLLLLLMFNWTAYSQITGISHSQKQELVKTVVAYDECRETVIKLYSEIDTYKVAIDKDDAIIRTYENELRGNKINENARIKKIVEQETTIKKQKSSITQWKIFTVIAFIGGVIIKSL